MIVTNQNKGVVYKQHTIPIKTCGNAKWVILGHPTLPWGEGTHKSRIEFVPHYVHIASFSAPYGEPPNVNLVLGDVSQERIEFKGDDISIGAQHDRLGICRIEKRAIN